MARSDLPGGRPWTAVSARPRRRDAGAGFVTAETAVVVPLLVVLVGALLWGLAAAVQRIQCVDAARAGARAAARGESAATVEQAVRETAPSGARLSVGRTGGLVRVGVRARTAGPGPLAVEIRAEAVALDERRADEGWTDPIGQGKGTAETDGAAAR